MVRKFRIAGIIASVATLCVIGGLGLAQVKVVDPGAPRRYCPLRLNPPITPGQLSSTGADPDVEISPSGEPIVIHVKSIVAPALVFDRDGNIMNNLQPSQFHPLRQWPRADIHVDTEYQPISLVTSIRDEGALKQIHKIRSMIEPLVTGDAGEAAVVAFDHRIRTLQDFTTDPQKIKDSIAKISSGSSQTRMMDAVDQSIIMLRHRAADRRKIILLVSETRDNGSYARGRQTLIALQLECHAVLRGYQPDLPAPDRTEPPRPDPSRRRRVARQRQHAARRTTGHRLGQQRRIHAAAQGNLHRYQGDLHPQSEVFTRKVPEARSFPS